jgi:hypothetical protein
MIVGLPSLGATELDTGAEPPLPPSSSARIRAITTIAKHPSGIIVPTTQVKSPGSWR